MIEIKTEGNIERLHLQSVWHLHHGYAVLSVHILDLHLCLYQLFVIYYDIYNVEIKVNKMIFFLSLITSPVRNA